MGIKRACVRNISCSSVGRGSQEQWLERRSKGKHTVTKWLKHYTTSRKVAGSRLDEVYEFFSRVEAV
jgi:hypothetical protein